MTIMRSLAVVTAFISLSTPALAGDYGAFASDHDAKTFGWAWHRNSQEEANAMALRKCGTPNCKVGVQVNQDPSNKSIVAVCAAVAIGGGWGSASNRTSSQAESDAIQSCVNANPDHQCHVVTSSCNPRSLSEGGGVPTNRVAATAPPPPAAQAAPSPAQAPNGPTWLRCLMQPSNNETHEFGSDNTEFHNTRGNAFYL